MRRLLIALFAGVIGAAFSAPAAAVASPIPSTGYAVTLWASGNCSSGDASPSCYYNPDSITHDASHVFVGYQNFAAADGSNGNSEVVEYANTPTTPAVVALFTVPGKNDGLRVNPANGDVWALSNEDANPILTILHPGTPVGSPTTYHLPAVTAFAGGYDDIAFTPTGTFISASNPAGNHQGTNNYRSIVRIQFNGNGDPVLAPILGGSPTGTDRATGATVRVNLTDPDSLSVDAAGDLVLNDQWDSTLVFVANPGTDNQSVSFSFLTSGPPIVDETTWAASSTGHFLVADHSKPGAIFSLTRTGGFAVGQSYTTVSNDNPAAPAARTVSLLNPTTGAVNPIPTGFSSPKGLEFIS